MNAEVSLFNCFKGFYIIEIEDYITGFGSYMYHIMDISSGSSSGVERLLPKQDAVGSNPICRSIFNGNNLAFRVVLVC